LGRTARAIKKKRRSTFVNPRDHTSFVRKRKLKIGNAGYKQNPLPAVETGPT